MDTIIWKNQLDVIAATTLRSTKTPDSGNMALHTTTDKAAVVQNRENLAKQFHFSADDFVFANQIHSTILRNVRSNDKGKGVYTLESCIGECDALYTNEKGIAIGVFHADCVPILLYDPMTHIIAAIHAGWQGTLTQITTKTLRHLIDNEGMLPQHIHAYIGPCIAFDSFEVNKELLNSCEQLDFDYSPYMKFTSQDKGHIDIQGLNVQMLLNCGVAMHHIRCDKNDTFKDNSSFFSFRRDSKCGRHLSFIYMPK